MEAPRESMFFKMRLQKLQSRARSSPLVARSGRIPSLWIPSPADEAGWMMLAGEGAAAPRHGSPAPALN